MHVDHYLKPFGATRCCPFFFFFFFCDFFPLLAISASLHLANSRQLLHTKRMCMRVKQAHNATQILLLHAPAGTPHTIPLLFSAMPVQSP
jgi:hypothetical protein